MRRLYTISALLTALALSSCDYSSSGNVCEDEEFMEKVKLQTAYFLAVAENPENILFTSEDRLVKKLKPIADSLKPEDVSKAQRVSEGQYRCSAVFSYKGKRLASVYSITHVHSGKENLYKVEVQDVDWVE